MYFLLQLINFRLLLNNTRNSNKKDEKTKVYKKGKKTPINNNPYWVIGKVWRVPL
jgi:hypothetical protein